MGKPTKEDAALLIQIFGIESADEDYKKAVNWFFSEMNETDYNDYKAKNPIGSEGYQNFMTLCHYWELIGTLVNRDVLNEDLVFDMHGDMLWDKAEPIIHGMRKDLDMPRFLENYEVFAKKYPKWAENNPIKV
ncbi:MAG: hypothetical protein ACFE9S_14520 [Candidatus Hermodarchaeota archaeon]